MNNFSLRNSVLEYVAKKYSSVPEYLWRRFPNYAVLRHIDNNKWYAVIMDVPKNKLGITGNERINILNVKLDDPMERDMLIGQEGYFMGYHISRGNWISILLDGTVPIAEIYNMIDQSYTVTASKKKKDKMRLPKEWLIPANPKYYDIEHAFDDRKIIEWKQSGRMNVGDTVFMYVAAPISAILYKCKVVECDIPYEYKDKNLTINTLMKIEILHRYERNNFTFDILKSEYDIFVIRGPRNVPHSLSCELNKYTGEKN